MVSVSDHLLVVVMVVVVAHGRGQHKNSIVAMVWVVQMCCTASRSWLRGVSSFCADWSKSRSKSRFCSWTAPVGRFFWKAGKNPWSRPAQCDQYMQQKGRKDHCTHSRLLAL